MVLALLIFAVIGYLLGSLPFGYLVARAKGVNIFEVGSKNPGATNVRRVLGPGPGNLVFALDALKGAIAASWALLSFTAVKVNYDFELGGVSAARIEGETWAQAGVAGLLGALVGHSFSCFTKFRGGKGVATSAGGLIVVLPLCTLIAGAVWWGVFHFSRYVSLASIAAALGLVVAAFAFHRPAVLCGLAVVIAAFVILRHRTNIVRLLNGTENKFVKKGTPAKS